MSELFGFSLVALSATFFVVDPMGLLPIFIAITSKDSEEKRRRTARRAVAVAFGLLTTFAVFGSLIFKVFGISLTAFRVAGGLLLLITAIDMLRAQPSRTRSSPEETSEGTEKDDVAIVPLAMPLLAGPGAIATVMVLSARGGSFLYTIPVVASIAITCGVTYLMLRAAAPITRLLGHSGIAVLERVMGLLLAAIAVQFLTDGLVEIFANRPQT